MNFLRRLRTALSELEKHQREVLSLRMAADSDARTLKAISVRLSCSEEHAGAVEAESVRRLAANSDWFRQCEHRLAELLASRSRPLPLLVAEELDPSLHGLGRRPYVLHYLLAQLGLGRLYIVDVGGIHYLLDMPEQVWQERLQETRQRLNRASPADGGESDSELAVRKEGSDLSAATAALLLQVLEEDQAIAEFQPAEGRDFRNVNEAVLHVLETAEEPLPFRNIAEQAHELLGRSRSAKSIRRSIRKYGLRLDQDRYGQRRHIQVSPQDRERALTAIERILSAGVPGRQWHARELLQSAYMECGHIPGLNVYVLEAFLQESSATRSLGAFVWESAEAGLPGTQRILIQEAVAAVLKSAGRPMTSAELRGEIMRTRGLASRFRILPDRTVHLAGRRKWGLRKWEQQLPQLPFPRSRSS